MDLLALADSDGRWELVIEVRRGVCDKSFVVQLCLLAFRLIAVVRAIALSLFREPARFLSALIRRESRRFSGFLTESV